MTRPTPAELVRYDGDGIVCAMCLLSLSPCTCGSDDPGTG